MLDGVIVRGSSTKITNPQPEPVQKTTSHGLICAQRIRKSVRVRGIVQGVGFRPWVYHLAKAHGLGGFVLNSSAGVTVEVEGPAAIVARFLEELKTHPPALAQIDEL